ncbi:MAG: hypothetical protein ACRBBN_16780 [Methyloligellaceae bacterium]
MIGKYCQVCEEDLVRQAFSAGYQTWEIPENSHFLIGMVLAYSFSVLLERVREYYVMKNTQPTIFTSNIAQLNLKAEVFSTSGYEFPDFLKILEEAKASGFLEEKTIFCVNPIAENGANFALQNFSEN